MPLRLHVFALDPIFLSQTENNGFYSKFRFASRRVTLWQRHEALDCVLELKLRGHRAGGIKPSSYSGWQYV